LGNLAPARKFTDYSIEIDRDSLPAGVEILNLV
jgi:CRISPR-associated protein Csd2